MKVDADTLERDYAIFDLLYACMYFVEAYEQVGGVGDPEITSAYLKAVAALARMKGESPMDRSMREIKKLRLEGAQPK